MGRESFVLENGAEISCSQNCVTVALYKHRGNACDRKALISEIDAVMDKRGASRRDELTTKIPYAGPPVPGREHAKCVSYSYVCGSVDVARKAYQALVEKMKADGR